MALLSILICSLPERAEMLNSLMEALDKQGNDEIEIIIDTTPKDEVSIGDKRNALLLNSTGKYVCFIDDDDSISKDYIEKIFKGIETDPDCLSLRGCITWNGTQPEIFEHSIKYSEYKTTDNPIKYERYPNHLNVIRASIAKQFKFQSSNFGEDTDWATQIHESGLLNTEYYIDTVLYHYNFIPNK